MNPGRCEQNMSEIRDYGGEPVAVNIHRLARSNSYFRTVLWTGDNLQVTLMSIPVGGEIGIEMHPHTDQFLRIENGCAHIMMGKCRENLAYHQKGNSDYSVIVPAGTWHNIKNIGNVPLKLYSI
ncbi:MAG: cupin domain-containing protein, partial [Ruminococcus sp.]